ncbi:MAG: methyltransferase regulatory domain-containing protein [Pseudomonadota bacterium]
MAASTDPYDRYPYQSNPFAQTHPNRLFGVATLFGLTPANPAHARIAELGCAMGGNLLPLAEQLPDATLLGVDLSPRQIGIAQEAARATGFAQAEFLRGDLTDFACAGRQFDYIIAHGVYSWMPAAARDGLLRFIGAHLAPHGVAYVSYNTYPGWHMRGAVRDMMLYHTQPFEDEQFQIDQARILLEFLATNSMDGAEGAYRRVLVEELDLLKRAQDYYLRHEHLSGENQPVYFHQFAAHAARHGLKFLAEANLGSGNMDYLPDAVKQALAPASGDLIRTEQYLDFLRNRPFRQTLLVRDTLPLSRPPTAALIDRLYVPGGLVCEEENGTSATFRNADGLTITVSEAEFAAALASLARAGSRRVPVADLLTACAPTDEARGLLAVKLLQCFMTGFLVPYGGGLPGAFAVPEQPVASRIARYQAQKSNNVTTMAHLPLTLSALEVEIVKLCDGQRDQALLIGDLIDITISGRLRMAVGDRAIVEPGEIRQLLEENVPNILQAFVDKSLLLAP